jgi:hypothetical protein
VALKYYSIEKISEGAIQLKPGEAGTVSGPVAVGTSASKLSASDEDAINTSGLAISFTSATLSYSKWKTH